MYSTIQFGSLALPTGPLTSLLAIWLAVEISARMGRRYQVNYDDLFGVSMFALLAGLVGARLWHVFTYWDVYRSHLMDILSLRPTGLAPVPGYVCAFIAAYGVMIWRKLDPETAGATILTGLMAGGIVLFTGAFLSGRLIGTLSEAPWAAPYGDTRRHPAGLYQALGCLIVWCILWYRPMEPRRVILSAAFFGALVFLVTEAFIVQKWSGPFVHLPQIGYLLTATGSALILARWWKDRETRSGEMDSVTDAAAADAAS